MHEYAITESIVQLVSEEAKKANANKITVINIVAGEISGVIPECIELYFESIAEGTLLEEAKLNFEVVKAELKCTSCGEIFLKKKNEIECPKCGGTGRFTEKGKEFYIESIEID